MASGRPGRDRLDVDQSALGALVRLRRSPLPFLTGLAATHPRTATLRIGPERVVVVNDADLAHELLTLRARATVKGRGLARARFLLGDGLLTSEGDVHRTRRRRVQPAFHRARVEAYRPAVAAAAAARCARWSEGDRIDLGAEMSRLTLDVAGRTLFGADVSGSAAEVTDALTDVVRAFRTVMMPGGGLVLRSPLPAGRRLRRARARLDTVVDDLVRGRRRAPRAGDGPRTVLDLLLDDDTAPPLTAGEVRDEVMTLLLAGHETTALALTWSLAAVAGDEGVRVQLEDEWDRADVEDLRPDALPWTTATIAEALRLWPPAWVIGRRATDGFRLGDAWVPAGTLCLVSPLSLHRDPRWWSEPDRFVPQRWLRAVDEAEDSASASTGVVFRPARDGRPRGAYLPFGAGPRVCVGEAFAWAEAVALLAAVGSRWRVRLLGPSPVPGRPGITLRPRQPVRAMVMDRA
jgi:cytochrome P450